MAVSEREPVTIEGSMGEGGGQIVRTSITLSCLTGKPVRIVNVRANRPKPGLGHQHLAAIRAAAAVCDANLVGATLGSREFLFEPGPVRPGAYRLDVGTAGSTSLVLQTIALPLATAAGDSEVAISGGTHNPWAPCFEYLEAVWAPLMARMGIEIELQLLRAGFYPAGGGKIVARIRGTGGLDRLKACRWVERGELQRVCGFSAVARLPEHVLRRQADRAARRLEQAGVPCEPLALRRLEAASPGSVLFLLCRSEQVPAAFFALGQRGKPAERVADEAVEQLLEYLQSPGTLDPHAADQMVLPAALAAEPSEFNTTRITRHLITHVELLRRFVPRPIELEGEEGEPGRVSIGPMSGSAGAAAP